MGNSGIGEMSVRIKLLIVHQFRLPTVVFTKPSYFGSGLSENPKTNIENKY